MYNCKFYRIENNELFNIWNGFRLFYEGKLYSIGGNPSIREIDYKIYEEETENISNLSVVYIPDSDITDILKRNDYSEEEIELLRFIQNCNYSETFIKEKIRYDNEYQKQLIEENDIWDTYGELSPSRNELDLLIGQLEKIILNSFL